MLHSIKSHITRTRKPARPDVDEKDVFKTDHTRTRKPAQTNVFETDASDSVSVLNVSHIIA